MTARFIWKCINEGSNTVNPRSSHDLCSIGRKVFLFGGENIARTPIDSKIHVLDLDALVYEWEEIPVISGTPPVSRFV